jgi:tetratricopeptide (TPR) repeat protein
MIRMIALAAILVALVAAVAFYTIMRPPGTQLAATEEWPICSTMESLAANTDWAQLDPDFAAGKKAMAAGDWNGAIAVLKSAALRDPRNADIQNYIGYSYRRLRELEPAFRAFSAGADLQSAPPRGTSAHGRGLSDDRQSRRSRRASRGLGAHLPDPVRRIRRFAESDREIQDLRHALSSNRRCVHRPIRAAAN